MKDIETDLNMNGNQLINIVDEKVSTDPAGLTTARYWFNTTSGKKKFSPDGVAVKIIATEDWVQTAINQIGQAQGGFDASSGALPTPANTTDGGGDTAIRRGDYWDITVAGTITGIQGADELSVGDLLKFTGTTPTNAAHWVGIQRNLNDTLLGNVKRESQTVDLVANTDKIISAATLTYVATIVVFNSAGSEIIVDVKKGANPNQRVLRATRSLTNVVVDMTGDS